MTMFTAQEKEDLKKLLSRARTWKPHFSPCCRMPLTLFGITPKPHETTLVIWCI